VHQGHVDEMFGEKPYLELVGANDIAHDQVVGSIVASLLGARRGLVRKPEDELVSLE
jgi:hypothetical protein